MDMTFDNVDELVSYIITRRGRSLKVGLPLGIGKPNHIANELVQRAADGDLDRLEIFTALSLSRPPLGDNELKRRLMGPIMERLFGDYPDLLYASLLASGELPDNVVINDFFFAPGTALKLERAQRHHKNINFTDAYCELLETDLDVIGQMVAPGEEEGTFDLSCNTDLTPELLPVLRERSYPPLIVGQVNRRMPALGGNALVSADTFDAMLDHPSYDFELFGPPAMPISDKEYAIGLRVASLLRDGGTIQVGIGNLGEAVGWGAILRHSQPEIFQRIVERLAPTDRERNLVKTWGGMKPFEEGLYGSSEMFVEGLLRMLEAGVIKRPVDNDIVLHGAFFLGSPRFYESLRQLPDELRRRVEMTSVLWTNLLYGDEEIKRRQRVHARFVNSAMMVTALGAVVSDGLEDGRVVSGVGGQYEFVSMAHAMRDARAIIILPSIRERRGEVTSNIIWSYGHTTIPRHLRDIVVTEYGIADLRGKTDEEIVQALIQVADARFQDELADQARRAGKLAADWRIPERARRNRPEVIKDALAPFRADGTISRCPFGSSLTEIELDLVEALQYLRGLVDDLSSLRLPELKGSLSDAVVVPDTARPHLNRMGLSEPSGVRENLMQRALVYALSATGKIASS